MNNFECSIFIGRFSIFHNAHLAILKKALTISNKVIVVIGSSGGARTVRNPWSSIERQEMISGCLTPDELSRISFLHMKDYLYNNNMWVSVLQEKIRNMTNGAKRIALIGYESDETSFYLKLFPQFTFVPFKTHFDFHASNIRDFYFSHDLSYKDMVPEFSFEFLEKFKKTNSFKEIKNEKDYYDEYKKLWHGAPYSIIHTTVDCLVIKSGHILLIERKDYPGKGLLALPGGFINQNETIKDAALRELKKETGIKINTGDLRRSIKDSKVFDDPKRSERGRTITYAFLIDLGAGPLPDVVGLDDAGAAMWLPMSDVLSMQSEFFEDHYHVINSFIGSNFIKNEGDEIQ